MYMMPQHTYVMFIWHDIPTSCFNLKIMCHFPTFSNKDNIIIIISTIPLSIILMVELLVKDKILLFRSKYNQCHYKYQYSSIINTIISKGSPKKSATYLWIDIKYREHTIAGVNTGWKWKLKKLLPLKSRCLVGTELSRS